MRKTDDSNMPAPHVLAALRGPHRLSARAHRVPADHHIDEVCRRIADEVVLQGIGAPPPQLLKALRSYSPGRAKDVNGLMRTGAAKRSETRAQKIARAKAGPLTEPRHRLLSPAALTEVARRALRRGRAGFMRHYTAADVTFTPNGEGFDRIAREIEAQKADQVKPDGGRVLVRRGRLVLALEIDQLGPDDQVLADDDPYFRKKGRQRVVVEAWRDSSDNLMAKDAVQPVDGEEISLDDTGTFFDDPDPYLANLLDKRGVAPAKPKKAD